MVEIIFITLLTISILLVGVLGYLVRNLLKKIEIYEAWVLRFRTEIENVDSQLKVVDDRKLFEKDDDVGFVFSEISRVIKEFDNTIK